MIKEMKKVESRPVKSVMLEEEIVEKTIFETSDGARFDSRVEAKLHQELSSRKKVLSGFITAPLTAIMENSEFFYLIEGQTRLEEFVYAIAECNLKLGYDNKKVVHIQNYEMPILFPDQFPIFAWPYVKPNDQYEDKYLIKYITAQEIRELHL